MIILHILALLFFYPALFVTIPFHIIISMKEEQMKKQLEEKEDQKKKRKLSKTEIIFWTLLGVLGFVYILGYISK